MSEQDGAGLRGLRGRSVVVTGGGSGIGRAVALRLGIEGARVSILDRDAGGAEATADTIRSAGAEARVSVCDIVDATAVEAAIVESEEAFAPIGGLVNNAGWDRAHDFLDTGPDFWRKVIDINLYGPLNVTRAVLERMRRSGGGRVVTIASDAGRVGSTGEAVYSACKGGIIAFSKSVAREVARDDIQLNCVCPGPTDTPLLEAIEPTGKLKRALERAIPMGRVGTPDDYPGIVAFLLSDDAAYITGQTLSVSGGLTMHG